MLRWLKKKPGAASQEGAKNDRVRAVLRTHGDDGTRPRHVIHFSYPGATGGSASKPEAKRALGWAEVEFTETEDSEGIVFEHHREVASPAFDALTEQFRIALEAVGWDYDGWECAVETGED